jgi:hypothetical protein
LGKSTLRSVIFNVLSLNRNPYVFGFAAKVALTFAIKDVFANCRKVIVGLRSRMPTSPFRI